MSIFTKKIELYQVFDNDERFNFTNSNRFVTYDSVVYAPEAVERSKIELKPEMEKQSVTITVSIDSPLAQRYMTQIVESTSTLRIIEQYDGNYYNLWRGRLVNIAVENNSVNLVFENKMTRQLRSGAYRRYQRTCPFALYGFECKVEKEEFKNPVTVSLVSKNIIKAYSSISQFTENYFSGGIIELSSPKASRFITKSSASRLSAVAGVRRTVTESIEVEQNVVVTITVFHSIPNRAEFVFSRSETTVPLSEFTGEIGTVEVSEPLPLQEVEIELFNTFTSGQIFLGSDAALFAGCDKLNTTCAKKFNNIANFGGFPFIPSDNPFTGTII